MTRLALRTAPADLRRDYEHLRQPERRVTVERSRGCFIVEGRGGLRALLASPYAVRSVLTDERHAATVGSIVPDDVPLLVGSAAEIEALAGFAFHRGVLASASRMTPPPIEEVAAACDRLLVVEGVNDHENLGALYRNAAALGAGGVVLDPTTADPLYRRVVRVSVGNVLHVPTARASSWPDDLALVRAAGFELLALTPSPDAEPLDLVAAATRPGDRVALLVGAEGPGLTAAARGAADRAVCIPMEGQVDSLNVATAVAIALYELGRISRR